MTTLPRCMPLNTIRPLSKSFIAPVSRGAGAIWSPDGDTLFYVEGTRMMSVSIDYEPRFIAGTPALVFDGMVGTGCRGRGYDLSPDGQRFLFAKPAVFTEEAPVDLVVVQNWFEELNRLARPTE